MDFIVNYKPGLLFVDSVEATWEVMKDLLSGHMEISYSSNAKNALSKLASTDFAFMIVDTDLPDMDGLEFIKKAKEIRPYLQFVVLTAESDPGSEVRALQAGAMEFIRKPFTIEEIALLLEKFRSVSVHKKEEYDFVSAITKEARTFCLPTNLEILNVFIHELLEILKRFGLNDKNQMFSVRLSIYEMLINAYEHGNLGIDYDEKKRLLEEDLNYLEYLRDRALNEPYANRKIWVSYAYKKGQITFTIKDEGEGFDYEKYKDGKMARMVDAVHGRGILITSVNMDKMVYNKVGNEVTMTKQIKRTPF
ncbi:MAG: response regulator [Leptospirales bacterium]